MAGDALVAVFLVGALAVPLVLYLLVRRERERRPTMDRETAERVARRDTRENADDRGAGDRDADYQGTGELDASDRGADDEW